jgi:hypothetical protein
MKIKNIARPRTGLAAASSIAAFAFVTFAASTASANPRPLPFTYPYETLPQGSAEIEQYVDATWVRTPKDFSVNPGKTWDPNYQVQTELEYGITDRLEFGAYLVWSQAASPAPTMTFEGTKFRLRYRIGEEGQLPVDVALYLEGAVFHDEYELEEKVILSKRFGNLKVMANLWVEQEYERDKGEVEFVINPTIGATYQLTPTFFLGAEYWARGAFESEAAAGSVEAFNEQTHHFVGPAMSLNFGRVWWSLGVYARLDHLSRSSQFGDAYGKVWARSVLGLDF